MALIQALLTLVSRSLGRVVSAVFGWAVVALFGETSGAQKMWLSGLVAAAAAWPLLLIGIAAPRIAALLLAFVPIPKWVPAWTVRVAWITLAVAVPLAVGLAMAIRRPVRQAPRVQRSRHHAIAPVGDGDDADRRDGWLMRMIRGFPITIGVAGAFSIVFITVPVLRVMSFIRSRIDLHIPLVTDADSYEFVADEVERTLDRNGFEVNRAAAPWWMTTPSNILLWVDRKSFAAYVPRDFAYYRGPQFEAALYPNALLLRGREGDVGVAHGVLVEALTPTPGLQTFDPAAQAIEKQIHRVWEVYRQNPAAHRQSSALSARLREISDDIRRLPLEYDEWQVIYREALQLGRALMGEGQLLDRRLDGISGAADTEGSEDAMDEIIQDETPVTTSTARASTTRARHLTTRELVAEIAGTASLLVKTEVELAKSELKSDLQSELAMAKGLAVSAVVALLGLNALLVAGILALAAVMPGWLAGLIVGGALVIFAAITGYVSWSWRVTTPLAMTRKTIREDVQWAKERVA